MDPRNRLAQSEMESVFTHYLKKTRAYLELPFRNLPSAVNDYPVEASIIIPVRNRAGSIMDAVRSALDQDTDFPFNVIVVDNNSDDGTTGLIADLRASEKRVIHLIPSRTDLGIGGCWNEAAGLGSLRKVCRAAGFR